MTFKVFCPGGGKDCNLGWKIWLMSGKGTCQNYKIHKTITSNRFSIFVQHSVTFILICAVIQVKNLYFV